MAKTQKLKLESAWFDVVRDKSDGEVRVWITGYNTKGTRVEIESVISGWSINDLNVKYRAILDKRITSAIETRNQFTESVNSK